MKTDETQTVRVNNATGGTFTLTFDGQTTAPIAVQRDGRADRGGAARRSSNVGAGDVHGTGGPVNTANVTCLVPRRARSRRTCRR